MSKEDIEKRAFELWKMTGRQDSLANWSQAEREFFSGLKFRPVQEYSVRSRLHKEGWCGPACMEMIGERIGINVSQEKFAAIMRTTQEKGTSHKSMIRGAKALGLDYFATSMYSLEALTDFVNRGQYVVVDILDDENDIESGHYVLFKESKNGKVVVDDPSSRLRQFDRESFLDSWKDKDDNGVVIRNWALIMNNRKY